MSLRSQQSLRGVSLTELLVALTIALVFVGGVAAAFVQIIKASDEAEAQIRGHAAARSAVDKIGTELRSLTISTGPQFQEFLLRNSELAYGDNYDNDGDGRVDEESIDGFDNDFGGSGDWTIASDTHAMVNAFVERAAYVGVPDLGDADIDEDFVFNNDVLAFIVPPSAGTPRQRVIYRIDTFDGEDNVLVREVTIGPTDSGFATDPIDFVEPVVFDVVNFNVLAWNANSDAISPAADTPYWVTEWDTALKTFPLSVINAPFGTPPFKLPAAFHLTITINAEGVPLPDVGDWPPPGGTGNIKTVTVQSIVNVESVIKDNRYRLFVRES